MVSESQLQGSVGGRAVFPAAFTVSEEPETQKLFGSRKEVVDEDEEGCTRPVIAKDGKKLCYISSACRGSVEINNNEENMVKTKRSVHKKSLLEELSPCHCGGRSIQKVGRDDNVISLVAIWTTELLVTREVRTARAVNW